MCRLLSVIGAGKTISRVLSSDSHSSRPCVAARFEQPTRTLGEQRQCVLFGLAADGVLPAASCCQLRGALLPHLFTLTRFGLPRPSAVWLSVPLSVALPHPAVSRHPALCSPDFPPRVATRRLSVPPAARIIARSVPFAAAAKSSLHPRICTGRIFLWINRCAISEGRSRIAGILRQGQKQPARCTADFNLNKYYLKQ